MNNDQIVEVMRRCLKSTLGFSISNIAAYHAALTALREAGYEVVPVEPTKAMLVAAREWSRRKYGKPIGNDAARGCWGTMLAAARDEGETK